MECVAPDDTEGTMRWVAVFLAADYGTCLQRDFEAEAAAGRHQMGDLSGQPKALLPCGGGPILDHWLNGKSLTESAKQSASAAMSGRLAFQ